MGDGAGDSVAGMEVGDMTDDSVVGMGMGKGDRASVAAGDCALETMSGAGLIVGAGALGSRARASNNPSPATTATLPPRMAPT